MGLCLIEFLNILKERKLTQQRPRSYLALNSLKFPDLKPPNFPIMRFLECLNCEVSIHIWPQGDDTERVIAL
jgi:hypothetical protein